ncbi:MAG: isochorismate synthase [Acidimicrobiales bacterium]|nr:isochorismate synthase [Acidimicrobiales bacterium]
MSAAATPSLTAVTRRLDRDVDLVRLAGASGILFALGRVGFAGRGVAARVGSSDLGDLLLSMEVDDDVDRVGTGPVAFAALPFEPGGTYQAVVPSLVVGRDRDGVGWVTVVTEGDASTLDPVVALDRAISESEGERDGHGGPSSFTVTASRDPEEWMAAVSAATARIATGRLEKVVLAREVVVTADAEIPIPSVLARLARSYPGCYLYLLDGFCGASPELLVSRSGDVVRAQPMAGTAPRSGDPDADSRAAAALLASRSYRHEHQVTIDAVHDTLLHYSSYVDYEPEPSVVALANVVHLATSVEGRLSHPPASILELVAALHPTPAVCGRPRNEALAAIADLEDLDRDRYAGAVGWVDHRGNGQFAVSIRGAAIEGSRAVVVGGNGIVAESDPATELIETRAKMQAMLSAIVRP